MSGEKKAKGWRFYGLVGFGAIALLSAGVWALQYAGSGPEKTLSPLVVHNNLQIDLNEPDLFLDSDSLSQLPKDLLTIPFLHDVLSEDFVFYYQNHADRLGIEGSIRRIVYEHDLTLKDKLFSSLLDQLAQAALWHDKQGHLSHYMVLIQRSGLSKLLEPLLFAATSDSQLSKTEISSIKLNSETIPVYQLRYNGNNALMFATYQDKMLVFSSTDMLFKDDQQDTEATAIAGDLLSGKKRWQASFGLEERAAEKTPVRQRIVVSARLLGFGYQRLMPSFAGVRFEMGNDGWHSFVALNDESASVDTSFDFTPVWNSMPAGASFCVVVPYSHGIAEEMLSHISQENDKLNGALDGAAGLCWYADKAVKTRWAWLAVNLCTAFIASRVIDGFEHTISQLVALASLMPIVAGIGGNTGNQTITMIVRAMALQQIQPGSFTFLILREMGVALINGLVWGGIMGAITWWLYDDPQLGGVMTLAMMLNLLMAAMMGVIIPMVMVKLGRDPAVGSSVMITAITDTGGFFIFLGLATLFLM